MRLCLTILAGQRGGEEITIDPPGGGIGRSTDCVVCLPDASVSRQHAELRWDGQGWLIRSLSNSSPTAVDSTVVTATEVRLVASGQLRLGTVPIQYVQQKAAAVVAATPVPLRAQVSALPASLIDQLEPMQFAQATPTADAGPVAGVVSSSMSASSSQSPPTLIRRPSPAAPPPMPSVGAAPPTMLLPAVRRPVVESAQEPPATLIRRPTPSTPAVSAKPAAPSAPPTMIRPAVPPALPRLDALDAAPPTMIRSPVQQAAAATAQPIVAPAATPVPLLEHIEAPRRSAPPPIPDESALLKRSLDEMTRERDRLRAEVTQLKQDADSLCATQTTLQEQLEERSESARASSTPSPSAPVRPVGAAESLRLTGELGDLLEQASQALKGGETARAGSLIRDASFALADFRDLCQEG